MRTPLLNGLGHALRWLRDRHGKKQYQVAAAAGITKGMLSAYETGRQRPSLETLEKLLDTLGCDLNDLHNAIQIINGRPENMRRKDELNAADGDAGGFATGAGREGGPVGSVLGLRGSLPQEEEQALSQMIDGFHRLLRHFHRTLSGLQGGSGGMAGPGEDEG